MNGHKASSQELSRLVIDDRRDARFKVHRSAFVSDEILALERERVFGKCWLYLGHSSELKQPGDFISRRVGGRPLLYTRDRDNKLNALYNTCAHRGALVCRERSGNRRAFTCGYHAWTFDEKGRFVGMPGREALPPDATDNCKLDLIHVERLEEFKGFVFVCYDKNAMSLPDYLAGAGEYLAYVADQGAGGMEIVTGTQDYCVGANWKLLQENSADGYHGVPTHSTYFDYLRSRDSTNFATMNSRGWVKNLGNGHAVSESIGLLPWGRPYARWVPGWGEAAKVEVEALNKEIMERLGPERGNVVANGDRNLLIFPNLVVNDVMATTIRTFYPVKPDHMEVSAWCIAPAGESATSRDRRLRNFVEFLGPAGFATPDDVEMLELCQRGYANLEAAPYNDISRGMLSNAPTKTDELQMRTFWRRWRQLVSGDPSLELVGP
ncbi:MAG: Rieske 2Fe-2S domain-containing protein [Rhodospirillales bacterium]|nr:Rieske 2Fe-2S domain-containing protein [Rhodospirillales bacterium]